MLRWNYDYVKTCNVSGATATIDAAAIANTAQQSFGEWAYYAPYMPNITFVEGAPSVFTANVRVLSHEAFGATHSDVEDWENSLAVSAASEFDEGLRITSAYTDIHDTSELPLSLYGVQGAHDLESLLTHELGHWALLDDIETNPSECLTTTMWWDQELGDVSGRSLHAYDIQGIQLLYDPDLLVVGSFEAVGGYQEVSLEWEDAEPGLGQSFLLLRGDACGGPFQQIAEVERGDPEHTEDYFTYTYTDTTVEFSRTYWYMIADPQTDGIDYASAAPTGLPQASPPSAPGVVNADLIYLASGGERVVVMWPLVQGALGYHIYRGDGNAIGSCEDDFSYRGSTAGGAFVDASPWMGGENYYRVRAYNTSGASAYSPEASECVVVDAAPFDTTLASCPSGGGARIEFSGAVSDACLGESPASVYAVRRSSPASEVKLWSEGNGGAAAVDTVWGSYDPIVNRLSLVKGTVSGCGTIVCDVYIDGDLVVEGLTFSLRSYDQDDRVPGAVDGYDLLRLSDQINNVDPSPCGDFDWSGDTDASDQTAFQLHRAPRHHAPRKLVAPNGGEVLAPGQTASANWRGFGGQWGKATLQLRRDGDMASVGTVLGSVADDGAEQWTVPGMAPGTDYRMRVIHSAASLVEGVNDYGRDSSDATFTIRPVPVAAVSGVGGKTTASFSWTQPAQMGGYPLEYEIRYLRNSPLSDSNFGTGTLVPNAIQPGGEGTPHCVELSGLISCSTYFLGIRTKMNGLWSLMSGLGAASTTCSGNAVVYCGEGLMGGGGGEESALTPPALQTQSAGREDIVSVVAVPGENSVLWGANGSEVIDYFRLGAQEPKADEYRVRLRETGSRAVSLDQLRFGAVDRDPGVSVIAGLDRAFVGTVSAVAAVKDASGAEVAGLRDGSGTDAYSSKGGQVLLVELGDATANTAVVVEAEAAPIGEKADSVGILVQKPTKSGGWTTIATVNPRRNADQTAISADGSATLRLVTLRDYGIRSVSKMEVSAKVAPQEFTLASADHSRLGSVNDAVRLSGGTTAKLEPGDTLELAYTATPVPSGKVRDVFLIAKGQYEAAAAVEEADLASQESALQAVPVFEFALGQARPNPSRNRVTISYSLAQESPVLIRVYDVAGRMVRTLVNETGAPGPHDVVWDARNDDGRRVSAGVYFYRMNAGAWRSQKKVVFLER